MSEAVSLLFRKQRPAKRGDDLAIEVRLDLMMVRRKMSLTELSERVGISLRNLSLLKTGKVKGIRFSTLNAICRELDCQPADILEYVADHDRHQSESEAGLGPAKGALR